MEKPYTVSKTRLGADCGSDHELLIAKVKLKKEGETTRPFRYDLNQSILKEINPGYSLEGLMLKLKLQCFGHLMWRADSLEKMLMLGKIEGRKRRGWQRMRWLDDITNSMDMSLGKLQDWWWTGRPGVLRFMGLQRVRQDWVTELKWRRQKTYTPKTLRYWSRELKMTQTDVKIHHGLGLQESILLKWLYYPR